ncbi:type 1 fimbria pilin [Serratia fonticola]|uniref:Type 1 fimbria pilin n=1 Tax=Serratia fonticola TaxID=47917 RepID=A0A542CY46_SERFO|nr:fimbrial protein [Serratia fonticola]TQI82243.1 type 1 fimbria pilin [Serratia fonticola]TQI95737.1 type 1 fimbria pilin [Serratia fonticola]TVZ70232.1 type 1 fimbria pilin [Serratia fonticola]
MQQHYPVPGKYRQRGMKSRGSGYCRIGALLGVLLTSVPVNAMQVNIRGTVILPPPCTINNNQTIRVDFGDEVMTTRIDGVNYKQVISYTLDCDIQKTNDLKMSIQGGPAGFNSGLLSTNKPDLGIALYQGTQQVNINSWFNYTYPNQPVLYAVPVKRSGATLTGGEFAASATLLIDYQ